MPYSNYRPEFMGSAALDPQGKFEAGSYQSFTLTYVAGRFGIDDTGSIKIGFRFATDFGPVQFDSPSAPGYTTIEASNGAELECRWEFRRNIRPWSRSLYIGVKKHFLLEGDTITVRFGDRRQGSPGIRMQTYVEKEFEFRVFTDVIPTYDYVALPNSPMIEIVSGPPSAWKAVLPTLVRTGQPFRLSIKAEDKWGNPSDLAQKTISLSSTEPVTGLPEQIEFERGMFAFIAEQLHIEKDCDVTISLHDEQGEELCRTNPLVVKEDAALLHYWGDLHGQSNETLGTNTARDYFLFGRDKAFLDICAHQGNDFQIMTEFWEELNNLTFEFNEPGRYVCIPGYEWSANTAVGGDRNVFYRDEGRPIYRSSHAQIPDLSDEKRDAHNAHQLFESLQDEDAVVFSHCGGRYADITYAHDGRKETAIEIHSAWGTFEWLLKDAFEKGFRVGIVGNSDGHKGRVGASFPGASFFGAYGGLTCYLAPRLTREAIFEAMRRRHHYATTGNRLYLDTAVHLQSDAEMFLRDPSLGPAEFRKVPHLRMGDIARVTENEAELAVEVIGSAPIEKLEILDGVDVLETIRPYDTASPSKRLRIVYSGAEYRGRARTTNWDGKLSLSGNKILRNSMFNNWNLDRGIQFQDETTITWKAVTTGNFGGFDLWLADEASGNIVLETQHVKFDLPIADISFLEKRFEAGGLDRLLKIYRIAESMTQTRMSHRRPIAIRDHGDTRLLVRVTQADGHRAWSSPIYLFKA